MRLSRTGLVVLSLGIFGCAVPARQMRLAARITKAHVLIAQGQPERALAQVRRMDLSTARPVDHCRSLVVIARSLLEMHRDHEWPPAFREAARACDRFPILKARALLELGKSLWKRGARGPARAVFRAGVLLHPNEPAARRSVVWLERSVMGRFEAIAEFRKLYAMVRNTEVAPYLLYRAAALADEARDYQTAMSLRWLLVERYPGSHLADHCRLELAAWCLQEGCYWQAIDLLWPLVASHESSWWFGSYDTPSDRRALAMLPSIVWLASGDASAAARLSLSYALRYPARREAATALLRALQMAMDAGDQGLEEQAFRLLMGRYRDSEQARMALKLMGVSR